MERVTLSTNFTCSENWCSKCEENNYQSLVTIVILMFQVKKESYITNVSLLIYEEQLNLHSKQYIIQYTLWTLNVVQDFKFLLSKYKGISKVRLYNTIRITAQCHVEFTRAHTFPRQAVKQFSSTRCLHFYKELLVTSVNA